MLLAFTEIESSLEYESEGKTSISSALLLYIFISHTTTTIIINWISISLQWHKSTQLYSDEADYSAILGANCYYVGIALGINGSNSDFLT